MPKHFKTSINTLAMKEKAYLIGFKYMIKDLDSNTQLQRNKS